ncbi:MAG: hypothetical protein DDT26_00796 [Dehalococcoidia bacterium]|nr:hypothetical protein [Chloroflexota bacterium]
MTTSQPTVIAVDRNKIKGVVEEISNALTRIAAEREFIKEAIAENAEKYSIPKKQLSKLAKTYFKNSFHKEKDEAESFIDLYEITIGNSN